jgi:cell wall-associated NlpC family hydrolase
MPARPQGTAPASQPGRWRHVAAAVPATAIALGLVLAPVTAGAAPVPGGPAASSTTAVARLSTLGLTTPQSSARRADHAPVARPARPARVVVDRAALVLHLASLLRGRPYHYGAVGPRSFDCSGFTRYVFGRAVHRSLPHSSAAQYRLSHKIAKSAIRSGDLVFFVSGGHVYHVGIYAGHGLIWHAPHTGDHVRLAAISTSSWVAGRVL